MKMWKLLAAACLSSALLLGCHTVTPQRVTDTTISFDGNEQNGGFIGYTTNGFGVLTPRGRERYNALIDTYGASLTPPLTNDYGVQPFTNGTWLITKEAVVKFNAMNARRKAGK